MPLLARFEVSYDFSSGGVGTAELSELDVENRFSKVSAQVHFNLLYKTTKETIIETVQTLI
jgi:hypothetical protein